MKIVVTGAAGGLGRRVVPLLAADPDVRLVVAVDLDPVIASPKVDAKVADLLVADLETLFRDADVIIHLASSSRTEVDDESARRVNVDGTARLLAAASASDVRQLVVLSSAMVYGAWPTNPVPLTETAPLRPNPEFAYAMQRAQVERMVAEWVESGPDRRAAVLRPAIALSEDETSSVARALATAAGIGTTEEDPPQQFVSLSDLAAAVDLARRARLDGPYNVAPDGWIPGEQVRALTGSPPKVRLPVKLAAKVAHWSWELQLGPIPPGLLPYTLYPWVVANDRLKAAGWTATSTNEEAYVAATEGSWWSMMSPKRKQELALGAAGAALLVSGTAVGYLVRRAARARR